MRQSTTSNNNPRKDPPGYVRKAPEPELVPEPTPKPIPKIKKLSNKQEKLLGNIFRDPKA